MNCLDIYHLIDDAAATLTFSYHDVSYITKADNELNLILSIYTIFIEKIKINLTQLVKFM